MAMLRAVVNAMRGARLVGLLSLCVGGLPAGQVLAEKQGEGSKLQVQVTGQAVSAEIGGAGLAEVLRELAERAGFAAELSGELGRVQPQAFEGVPLDEAIRRLIGDNRVNLVMRYEVGADGKRRLAEVRAHAATEVSREALEEQRMRLSLGRVQPPPPPPPPAFAIEPN